MADVRCPMCGKPNPEERDTCQFCDARLKPLIINQPESESVARPGDQQAPQKADDLQGDMPDWLTSMQSSQGSEAPQGASGGDVPDWLSDMRSDFGESSQPAEEEKPAEPEEMDWMARLGTSAPAEEAPAVSDEQEAAPPKRVSSGMTDWFKNLPEEEKEPAGEALPDWLSESKAETPEPASAETPDWLDSLGAETQEPAGEALPDWLSEPKAETPEPASAESPDWLDSLGAATQEPAGEAAPDWLLGAEQAKPEEPVSDEEPSWLTGFEADTQEAAGEDSMDWLAGLKLEPEKAAGESETEAESLDWLSQFELEEPSTVVEPPISWGSKQPQTVSPAEGEFEPEQTGEAGPDWLKELETNFSEMPDAQVDIPPLPIAPREKPSASPFEVEDMDAPLENALPDWLTEAASDQAQPIAAEAAAPDLSPGDLPSWLEAMRPVEAVDVSDAAMADLPVEGAGPLAGLRGVLPAEPDIAHVRKPPVYSVKLQVSDIQQANADLLEQIVKNEGEAQPVPGRPVITPQHVLRILIGVVLTLSILAPLVLGIPVIDPPTMMPDVFVGEFQARQVVESLAPGQPVLLVFDYEPGFSGEMEAATGAVLNHLSLKGAYLTLVSSTPTGPIQAEHLMAAVNISQNNYLNLGFVSGGTSGLLSFIDNPRNTLPVTWDGKPAWEAPALQNINSLENFALIIVATESAEAGRAWIEQAYPRLKDSNKSMIMIVSAQVDPIIRPYFEAYPRQIQGLVSGLAGGAAYESSFGRAGNASIYWSAFSVGLLMACFLVILGGALNAATALMANSKKTTGKEG